MAKMEQQSAGERCGNMIHLIDLEAIPTRYSEQWRTWIPELFDEETNTISGTDYEGVSDGGFFDFTATNIYKSEQVIAFGKMIKSGKINDGDALFFYDIWHPGIVNIKYMLDLAKLDVKIYGVLHAGAYDETDILGINNLGRWAAGFEESMIEACDQVFVFSEYHRDMVLRERKVDPTKISVGGFPYNFKFMDSIQPLDNKDPLFVFPHRISPDKQPEIFDALKAEFPDYGFIRTMDLMLPKDDYHELLKRAKYVFSAALHENLGISTMEAVVSGCIPILPNRCSYSEIYEEGFLYKSDASVEEIVSFIKNVIENNDKYEDIRKTNIEVLKREFFNFDGIKDHIQQRR